EIIDSGNHGRFVDLILRDSHLLNDFLSTWERLYVLTYERAVELLISGYGPEDRRAKINAALEQSPRATLTSLNQAVLVIMASLFEMERMGVITNEEKRDLKNSMALGAWLEDRAETALMKKAA